jgi:hypothetical protein
MHDITVALQQLEQRLQKQIDALKAEIAALKKPPIVPTGGGGPGEPK